MKPWRVVLLLASLGEFASAGTLAASGFDAMQATMSQLSADAWNLLAPAFLCLQGFNSLFG